MVIGSPESVQAFATDVAPDTTPGRADEIVVVGGTEIGYQTADYSKNATSSRG